MSMGTIAKPPASNASLLGHGMALRAFQAFKGWQKLEKDRKQQLQWDQTFGNSDDMMVANVDTSTLAIRSCPISLDKSPVVKLTIRKLVAWVYSTSDPTHSHIA